MGGGGSLSVCCPLCHSLPPSLHSPVIAFLYIQAKGKRDGELETMSKTKGKGKGVCHLGGKHQALRTWKMIKLILSLLGNFLPKTLALSPLHLLCDWWETFFCLILPPQGVWDTVSSFTTIAGSQTCLALQIPGAGVSSLPQESDPGQPTQKKL